MTIPPVADQEYVVHAFAPLGGPQADRSYQQIQQAWQACREQLGLTDPVPATPALAELPGSAAGLGAGGVLAARQSPGGKGQVVLRRVHDVLSLSVAMAWPECGWADADRRWGRVLAGGSDALLGEARLFLARVGPGSEPVTATAELGQSLADALPPRPPGWWRRGETSTGGFAVWDIGSAAATGPLREIVLATAADRDAELSAWAWSDGTPEFPPLAAYLLFAAKLRFEARLLEAWHRRPDAGGGPATAAAMSAVLAPDPSDPGRLGPLRSWADRLAAEETRLTVLQGDLARLAETVASARHNLEAAPGCRAAAGGAGLFAADQELARWLGEQASADLSYAQIDLRQVQDLRALTADELSRAERASPPPARAPSAGPTAPPSADAGPDVARRVFVVHGRDTSLAGKFFDLLRRVDLRPLEWETLVRLTGSATPFLGSVVNMAPRLAQATLVLLTPDDLVELHSDLRLAADSPDERGRGSQARPNVLVELGMALMAHPDRTVIVQVGHLRPIADIAGLNIIHFDGSAVAIAKVIARLQVAGCAVERSGTDWLDPSPFAGMTAERRSWDTHEGRPPGDPP